MRFFPVLVVLAAAGAHAQVDAGAPLVPVATFRGPFQHAVVGSSLVSANGTVLPTGGANLSLPPNATLANARLFWMGSRSSGPDLNVQLKRPDGTVQDVGVTAADCKTALNVLGAGANYYQCSID